MSSQSCEAKLLTNVAQVAAVRSSPTPGAASSRTAIACVITRSLDAGREPLGAASEPLALMLGMRLIRAAPGSLEGEKSGPWRIANHGSGFQTTPPHCENPVAVAPE